MADIAHISGLVCAGLHPSPVNIADVTTASTYKTIRGPHGGMIIYGKHSSKEMIKNINRSLIIRLQSALHTSHVAAKAVCFYEALSSGFKRYQRQIINNAQAMALTFKKNNIAMITGGTDNHLILLDLRRTGANGKELQDYLESINILTNKNLIPFDKSSPDKPSGLRIGTSSFTSMGYGIKEAQKTAEIISQVIKCKNRNNTLTKKKFKKLVKEIIRKK